MAYEKRVYTPGEEVVTYEDMNRIEEGIFNNAEAITALEDENTEQNIAITEKVKVNGTATNVNFIEKKVVQEGLVKQFNNNTSLATDETANISSTSVIDISFYFTAKDNSGTYTEHQIINFGDTTYISVKRTDMRTLRFVTGENVLLENSILDKQVKIRYVDDGTKAKLFIDDKLIIESAFSYTYTSIILRRGRNLYSSCCAYNLILTTQEVNNNFSVLSSTKAIGAINDYTLAVDTDHTVDRSNRLQETINRTFYKQFCKEFTSTDGTDIVVGNGMDGYVLSGEIKGQTVKNEFYARINGSVVDSQGVITIQGTTFTGFEHAQSSTVMVNSIRILKPSTKYTVVVEVLETNYTGNLICGFGTSTTNILVSSTGIKTGIFTTTSTTLATDVVVAKNTIADRATDKKIVFKLGFYEGDLTANNPIKTIQFGLSSTKAIIQNNGIQYPVYATQADKTSNIPISLGGVGGVYDTLTLNEDGSGVYTQNFKIGEVKNLTYTKAVETTEFASFGTPLTNAKVFNNSSIANAIANFLNVFSTVDIYNATKKGFSINSNGWLYLSLPKTELTTLDSVGVNKWLSDKGFVLCYQLATPVTTAMPKELIPTILTTKANTINLDSAVKASSLKVSLPVDRIAELQSQVTALQNAVLLLQS